jgi:hypothetical protein
MPLQNGDVSKTVSLVFVVIPIRPVKSGGRTSECHFSPLVGLSKVVVGRLNVI